MASHDRWSPPTLVAHLFALTAFGVAQPLFDLLGRSPEFFLVRRADRVDLLAWTAVIVLGPTIVLGLLEGLAGMIADRVRRALHVELVGLLGALCALPLINRNLATSSPTVFGLAAAAGLAAAGVYAWSPTVRAGLTWLAPAGLVFPIVFLLRPPMRFVLAPPAIEFSRSGPERSVPIVVIVFDEFPVSALLGDDGDIDAALFPSFARLAREGTWFRNATTIATTTPAAVAGIVTGTAHGRAPLDHPKVWTENLFTMLAASHHFHVRESYVPFCMNTLCGQPLDSRRERLAWMVSDAGLALVYLAAPPSLAKEVPDINAALLQAATSSRDARGPIGRATAIDEFLSSITPSQTPTLHYLHLLLPHVPYVYEPSGKACVEWADTRANPVWYDRDQDALVLYQRLLMQVGWVDGMVGRLLAQLGRTGLYDQALLIVVADHGISFRVDDERRALSNTNACDVLGIPLFVKLPGQQRGGISDRNVEVIDVLPTIADVVGITILWPVSGQSMVAEGDERPRKTVVGPSWRAEEHFPWSDDRLEFPPRFGVECIARGRPGALARGAGRRGIFRVGPYGDLVGHAVREEDLIPPEGIRLALSGAGETIEPGRGEVRCLVEGHVSVETGSVDGLDLAVAVDGTIEAVGRARSIGRPVTEAPFAIPVPSRPFEGGQRDVRLFVPRRDGERLRLVPLFAARYGRAADSGPSPSRQ